mmetsp:Transcript_6876/g.12161  ORF Transcript_6876/g.12161 Transcript_6876/m.12161 type:complete len:110 (-) Transcript_6876:42-371(-)
MTFLLARRIFRTQPRAVNVRSLREFCSFPERIPPRVRFARKRYCPECGKNVVPGEKDDMREACTRMWKKFMGLDDQHCPLFRACEVKTLEGHEEEPALWEPMPRLKGRS